MVTKLSSKGQVVLPKQARIKLQLRAGTKFSCQLRGGSIVLTPEGNTQALPILERDAKSGLIITKSQGTATIGSKEVRAAMEEFP